MKNRFTILGCGSSLGVPWINGNYGKCNPKNNKNIRNSTFMAVPRGIEPLFHG